MFKLTNLLGCRSFNKILVNLMLLLHLSPIQMNINTFRAIKAGR
jgi:hypothetical protein